MLIETSKEDGRLYSWMRDSCWCSPARNFLNSIQNGIEERRKKDLLFHQITEVPVKMYQHACEGSSHTNKKDQQKAFSLVWCFDWLSSTDCCILHHGHLLWMSFPYSSPPQVPLGTCSEACSVYRSGNLNQIHNLNDLSINNFCFPFTMTYSPSPRK